MLPLILDGLILLLLAATVFFAARLSLQLKAFRESRKDLQNLIGDLSTHIIKAEKAIGGLQENARQSGRELEELIVEAQALRDELQIISDSGDSLASRLERLAGQAKQATTGGGKATGPSGKSRKQERPAANEQNISSDTSSRNPLGAFSIRDRDLETAENETAPAENMSEDGTFPGEGADDEDMMNFHSQAERDLYEALQKNKGAEKADSF